MYKIGIFTAAEDMYRSYKVAKLLNPKMREEDYKLSIDRITKTSNYKQYVVLFGDEVVSMVATQDVLVMSNAPRMTCKLDNVATLPEHRGHVTSLLMNKVKDDIRRENYGGLCLDCDINNDRGNNFYKRAGFERNNNGWVMKFSEEEKSNVRN